MTAHDELNWFAVRTKRFAEAVASRRIQQLSVETFLPLIAIDPDAQPAIRVDRKPLFPCYLFARFVPSQFLETVEGCHGVLHVIRTRDVPVPVDVEIIDEIRERVEPDGLIRLQRPTLRPGDRVSIQSGVLEGLFGRVEAEMDDQKRVAILLEAMWNARVVIESRSVVPQAA